LCVVLISLAGLDKFRFLLTLQLLRSCSKRAGLYQPSQRLSRGDFAGLCLSDTARQALG